MWDTGLADRLRAEGLDVVECDGWQTRGRGELYPAVFVFHHTADGPNGATPSLNGVIYGFSGSAPGPLANLLQSREPDGNDKVYVVAAGSSNNAGSGGWGGHSGNSSTWGLEIEHTGTEHFPEHRAEIACRIAAATIRGTSDEQMCCQHFEWSTAGKIDVAQDVDANHWRDLVRDALTGALEPEEPEIDWEAIVRLQQQMEDDEDMAKFGQAVLTDGRTVIAVRGQDSGVNYRLIGERGDTDPEWGWHSIPGAARFTPEVVARSDGGALLHIVGGDWQPYEAVLDAGSSRFGGFNAMGGLVAGMSDYD